MTPFVRRGVRELPAYRGIPAGRPRIRLDGNENPLGPSPRALEALRATESLAVSGYPSVEPLRAAWAAKLDLPPERVLITSGSGPGIMLVGELVLDPGDTCVISEPSFELYAGVCRRRGARAVAVPAEPRFRFPTAALVRAIERTPNPRLVIAGNPDNPTGAAPDLHQLEPVIDGHRSTLFLFDEAYFEFHGVTARRFLDRYDNVVITRTMSKAYGLAGLRLGCVAGDAAVIDLLGRLNAPYPVTGPALGAALAALEDDAHVAATRALMARSKSFLIAGLRRAGFECIDTCANFVLMNCRTAARAQSLTLELLRAGIAVRDRSGLPGMAGWVRVSCGTPEEIEEFSHTLLSIAGMTEAKSL